MKYLSLIVCLFCTTTAFGQGEDNFLTKQHAMEDLSIFEATLREIHPNIYRYTPKLEFDVAYKAARNSIGDSVSLVRFNNIINSIMAKVRCGHSFGISSFIDKNKGVLPLEVKIIDGKLFVLRNFSTGLQPPPGSEILSINGTATADIINEFRNNSVTDGYNITFKDKIIERNFRNLFASLINQPDNFEINFNDYITKREMIFTVGAISNDTIKKAIEKLQLSEEKPLGLLIDKENDIAILKLRSFMADRIRKQHGQKLNKTIKKSFREIGLGKVDNLIIDIRWNTGGKASAPPLLFSYLTNNKFNFKRKIVFRHGYQFSYPQYLNRDKFGDWVNKHLDKKINDTTFEWTHHRNTRMPYKASKKSFQGRVFIVANGMTASAGAEFASLARVYSQAIFIGEETGGDFNGVNGYERTHLKLPNSKISLLIAGKRSIMAWPEDQNIGHGVPPDYRVSPTIEDLLAGQDTEIKFTYALIKKLAEKN